MDLRPETAEAPAPEGPVPSGAGADSGLPPRVALPRVALHGIRKTFGSIEALRGVDLEVYPGECVGLIGDNAAGKSTLTKIISGTYLPDAGTIAIDGETVVFADPAGARARNIEMVFQDLSLCDHVDVMGNLFLGREITHWSFLRKSQMRERAREMLDDLDIRIPRLNAKVAQLSGGQRQAIAIARAASFGPRVLIMDEPTSALAVAEVEAVLRLIHRIKARGVAVILITHRLQDLFRVCDRVAVMYEGTKVAERAIGETSLEDLVKLIVGKGEAL